MRVLVLGCLGQDGFYISKRLSDLGLEVVGVYRSTPSPLNQALLTRWGTVFDELVPNSVFPIDPSNIIKFLRGRGISFIVNMATNHTSAQQKDSVTGAHIDVRLSLALLESLRISGAGDIHLTLPSSALIFEGSNVSPQAPQTSYAPISPYALAKVEVMRAADKANSEGLSIFQPILYPHDSILRPRRFFIGQLLVTLARSWNRRELEIEIAAPQTRREWGDAEAYAKVMSDFITKRVSGKFLLSGGSLTTIADFIKCLSQSIERDINILPSTKSIHRVLSCPLVGTAMDYHLYSPHVIDSSGADLCAHLSKYIKDDFYRTILS